MRRLSVERSGFFSVTIAVILILSTMLSLSTTYLLDVRDKLALGVSTDKNSTPVRTLALAAHDPIFIDGNAGFTNESGVVWGSGTESDPYVIEGWDIGAPYWDGICIKNTNAHFVVTNCRCCNASNSGIELSNCTNGLLSKNSCSNNGYGIYLSSSSNNTLRENSCDSHSESGIYIVSSNSNVISNNFCSDNVMGMWLYLSCDNILTDNNCSSNYYGGYTYMHYGILLSSSSDNIFTNNTCDSNYDGGILLYNSSDNCTLTNNVCSHSTYGGGINVWLSDNVVVTNNICTSNGAGLFTWDYCENETISNNILTDNSIAINLYTTHWSTVSDNDLSGSASGITLWECDNNSISNNDCSGRYNDIIGSVGISLGYSNNNSIHGSICSEKSYGMDLSSWSRDNTISSNTCSNNFYCGILVHFHGRYNTISNNICSNNGAGISLDAAYNNTASNNICSGNAQGINICEFSNNNTIIGNTCSNNGYGVFIDWFSGDNRIWNNAFYHNNGAGDTYDPSHAQALDEGPKYSQTKLVGPNWWNSTDGYGNWWCDCTEPDDCTPYGIVDSPYVIPGGADAADYYPLTIPGTGMFSVSGTVSLTSGTLPLSVSFTCSVTGGVQPYSYLWFFGDGVNSTQQNPIHLYSSAGEYAAKVIVTDSSYHLGQWTSSKIIVTAQLTVSGTALPISGSFPLNVSFECTAVGGIGPYSYSWTFGDGGTSSQRNSSHVFASSGTFGVTVTVMDNMSNAAQWNTTVTVTSDEDVGIPDLDQFLQPLIILAVITAVVALIALAIMLRKKDRM